MANKNIVEVDKVKSLTNTDSLFVNSEGSLKQITMEDISAGGEMMDLLWENQNPTSAFAAQTINLDLSGYDAIEIVTTFSAGGTNRFSTKLALGENTLLSTVGEVVGANMKMYMVGRNCSANVNGVIFNTGGYKYFDTAAFVESNTYAVPYRIYGVRNSLTSLLAPSVKIDKLWTNPSPDATFTAQTINLDLNEYDKVEVVYRGHGWDGTTEITANMHTVISVGGVGILNNSGMSTSNSYYTYAKTRKATVNASGVAFSTGYVSRITGEPSQDNNACIPQEIYGIKVETQPVIGGMTMELIWENASPTSSFAASQTINLDLSKYDLVKIQFNLDSNGRMVNSFDTPLNRACMFEALTYTRHFAVYEDKITFQDCTNTGAAIPYRIYGIKY